MEEDEISDVFRTDLSESDPLLPRRYIPWKPELLPSEPTKELLLGIDASGNSVLYDRKFAADVSGPLSRESYIRGRTHRSEFRLPDEPRRAKKDIPTDVRSNMGQWVEALQSSEGLLEDEYYNYILEKSDDKGGTLENDEDSPENDMNENDDVPAATNESTSSNAMYHKKESFDTKVVEKYAIEEVQDIEIIEEYLRKAYEGNSPPISYPFTLDDFQKRAVFHLERRENVFVSAHTSAGKTLVAEYGIALSLRHLTRLIYTSPIKTLSNQKFRDFKKKFGEENVGIITGDVQIRPTAPCLVMTTEILRSMLYRGADIIRDVEWVVFDEVHYVNDTDRGVVWEECLIMLPRAIRLILLSATVPNAIEFAEWIGRTKKRPVYVIRTATRPVPLEHFLYFKNQKFPILDSTEGFNQRGYHAVVERQKKASHRSASGPQRAQNAQRKKQRDQWSKMVRVLYEKDELPAVFFCFSRKRCEKIGNGLRGVDFTTTGEKSLIRKFIDHSLSRLPERDRNIPQIERIRSLLSLGIGVHHAGLLPIVKEIVEMLFNRGLCRVLFATETFAMGVNMPTRTAVFTQIRKHDGRNFRELLTGEYIQMSGRAGRRGIDTVGTVMIFCEEEVPDSTDLRKLLLGKPTVLHSQFHLRYNMILNILRVEDFRVEDVLRRSFSEFSTQRSAPMKKILLKRSKNRLRQLAIPPCAHGGESEIEDYCAHFERLSEIRLMSFQRLLSSKSASKIFIPGRLLALDLPDIGTTVGVILSRSLLHRAGLPDMDLTFRCAVLKPSSKVSHYSLSEHPLPPISQVSFISPLSSHMNMDLIDVGAEHFRALFASCLDLGGDDVITVGSDLSLMLVEGMIDFWTSLYESSEEHSVIDPFHELRLKELEWLEALDESVSIISKLSNTKCDTCPLMKERFNVVEEKRYLERSIQEMQFELSDENLLHMDDFENRLNVLQKLQYADQEATVLLKGRVACEINSCDELLLTELIFENFLSPLQPEEIICVLSCLICQERNASPPNFTEFMFTISQKMWNVAFNLGEIQMSLGVDTDGESYAAKTLNFAMIEVTYDWAVGLDFAEICQLTDIQEGVIVRGIVQLDQVCREVRDAARVIGDNLLFEKMEKAEQMIKRDIVFCNSLYIS